KGSKEMVFWQDQLKDTPEIVDIAYRYSQYNFNVKQLESTSGTLALGEFCEWFRGGALLYLVDRQLAVLFSSFYLFWILSCVENIRNFYRYLFLVNGINDFIIFVN